ncbi:MAG: acyl-CoA dehydratase activase [Deltaproteobacteria bacterium]|nr:acyl-CoA dehydratase activase [Deltaproteobacteria bacterium]
MIVAGCDVGSLTAKAVIMRGNEILAAQVIRAKSKPEESAEAVMKCALEQAGLVMEEISYCVGTGYGRNSIPFANTVESEIACHGKGAQWQRPTVRMVIDIGGQDAKAIRLDDKGNVTRYVYNDKCASGTGRFLEVMADALNIDLTDMGAVSLSSNNPINISNQCVIFAETEIVSSINEGINLADIVSGLHKALAHRVSALAKGIELEEEITMTGGVAKNEGMFVALQDALGRTIKKMERDPQINGALGAAIFAAERLKN